MKAEDRARLEVAIADIQRLEGLVAWTELMHGQYLKAVREASEVAFRNQLSAGGTRLADAEQLIHNFERYEVKQ